MQNKKKDKQINLCTPWSLGGQNYVNQSGNGLGKDESVLFIKERTRLHELYVVEQEKTKRLSLILAVVLILVAVFLLIAAPQGKETLTYIICGVLFIFAAGEVGYKRVWGKIPFTEFRADDGQTNQ